MGSNTSLVAQKNIKIDLDLDLDPIAHLPLKYIVLEYLGDEYISHCMGWTIYQKPYQFIIKDFHKLVGSRSRKGMSLFVSKYAFHINCGQGNLDTFYKQICDEIDVIVEINRITNVENKDTI